MKEVVYGVILAAGAGTRLGFPNSAGGKAMALVGNEPLLSYSIKKLAEAKIKKIALVVNPENIHAIRQYAGDGDKWSVELTYIIQQKPLGIAHALGLCKDFTQGHKMALLLVDNLFEASIAGAVQSFANGGAGANIFITKVDNPKDYGVAVIQNGRIARLVEKPQEFISHWAVIGVYLYDDTVYDIITTLKPSGRGELEITDVNKGYLARRQLEWFAIHGWWVDVGTTERLERAAALACV